VDGSADYAQKAAAAEGYQLMQEFSSVIEQLETQLNIMEGRLSPILLSPEPESELAVPTMAPLNNLHAEIQRLSDRVGRLMRINDRIRI